MQYKCPAIESTRYLCDRVAEYKIKGTAWCAIHARRILESEKEEEELCQIHTTQ